MGARDYFIVVDIFIVSLSLLPYLHNFFIIVADIFIVPNHINHIYIQLHPSFGFSPASLAGQNFLPNLPRVRSEKIFLLEAKFISRTIFISMCSMQFVFIDMFPFFRAPSQGCPQGWISWRTMCGSSSNSRWRWTTVLLPKFGISPFVQCTIFWWHLKNLWFSDIVSFAFPLSQPQPWSAGVNIISS